MNQIILIEDKPGRQAKLLDKDQVDSLKKISFLAMPLEADCRLLIDNINSNYTSNLSEYSLIIIHRSSLNDNGLNALKEMCYSNSKDLILFSGNFSQSLYGRDKYQSLSLNASDFYNNNLIVFLEKYSNDKSTSLLELIYGSKWKLELLLRYRLIKNKEMFEEDEYVKLRLEEETKGIQRLTGISTNEVDSEIDKIISAL